MVGKKGRRYFEEDFSHQKVTVQKAAFSSRFIFYLQCIYHA